MPIIEHVSDYQEKLARGEFGAELVMRPTRGERSLDRCFRGHDLSIAGCTTGWSHRYDRPTQTCTACWNLRDERASWCLVDPTVQLPAAEVPALGLALVRIPPLVPRGGVGQLDVRIDAQALGDVDVAICTLCRRAVIEQIRVDEDHRRLLIAAALALAPTCTWSTTKVGPNSTRQNDDQMSITPQDRIPVVTGRAAGRLPDW
jgi:hypothetical protein